MKKEVFQKMIRFDGVQEDKVFVDVVGSISVPATEATVKFRPKELSAMWPDLHLVEYLDAIKGCEAYVRIDVDEQDPPNPESCGKATAIATLSKRRPWRVVGWPTDRLAKTAGISRDDLEYIFNEAATATPMTYDPDKLIPKGVRFDRCLSLGRIQRRKQHPRR